MTQNSAPASVADALRHLLYSLIALATIGPVLWILGLSFKTRREFVADPFGLPAHLDLGNYAAVFHQDHIATFFANSAIDVAAALIIVLVSATSAAYALGRIPFRGRNLLFILFLMGDSIPLIVIVIPLFVIVQFIGLGGSRWSIILTYAAMNMGVSIYILRGFFRSIGTEIEEAARLDGCNLFQLVIHIILPIARPGLAVVALTNFVSFWNEYFLATILSSSQSNFTLPAGLAATFVNKHETNWPVMAAAVIIMIIPVIFIFGAFNKKILGGFSK